VFVGLGSDKRIVTYFKTHCQVWFSCLVSRTTFTRKSAFASGQGRPETTFHSPDTALLRHFFMRRRLPLPTCHPKRVRSKNPLKGIADFGFCAAKNKHCFGFKGHGLTTSAGLILEDVSDAFQR